MAQKFYLTKQGLEKLKKEYQALKNLRFSKINGEIPKILHSEDVNPEYLSFREDLSFLETRMEELKNVLKNVELIKPLPRGRKKAVDLGAKVTLDIDGQVDEFEIVGTLEANPALGRISNESPVGRALLGHTVGDEIIFSSPIKIVYKIRKIK
jgi:transcription elongation factor GreA